MKHCEWCGTESAKIVPLANLGNRYELCQKCFLTFKNKKCRKCGGPLGHNSIKGICMACTQLGKAEEDEEDSEINSGVALSQIRELTSGDSKFTEEDFENWITGKPWGKKTPNNAEMETYKQFVIKRFHKDEIWNEDNISDYIEDIKKLMERNVSRITSLSTHIIRVTDLIKFMGANIEMVDQENSVIMIVKN